MAEIRDPNTQRGMTVHADGRSGLGNVVALNVPLMHRLCGEGLAWTVPSVSAVGDTNDNALLNITNTGTSALEVHACAVGANQPGVWTLEFDRSRTAGGSAVSPVQLNTGKSELPVMTAFGAGVLTMTGTAKVILQVRLGANAYIDLMAATGSLFPKLAPNGKFTVRFQADAGSGNAYINAVLHPELPWENEA